MSLSDIGKMHCRSVPSATAYPIRRAAPEAATAILALNEDMIIDLYEYRGACLLGVPWTKT